MWNKIVFRLTLLYGGLFLLFSVGIYFWAMQTFAHFHLQNLDNHLHKEMADFREDYAEEGMEELWDAFREGGELQGKANTFYRLIASHQRTLASSDLTAWPDLPYPGTEVEHLPAGQEHLESIELPSRKTPVRVLTVKTADGKFLQAGIDMGEGGTLSTLLNRVLLVSLAVILILGSLGGGWIVHRAMRGVRRVTETAVGIGEGNLQVRVPLQNEGEEIDRLAAAFNSMLNRIASLVNELKEVSDNIAHDLKRPVTRIRGLAEMALAPARTTEEVQESAGQIIEECDQLVGMVNSMLEIARLDAAGTSDPRQWVDLVHLVRSAAELFEPMAEDRGLRISVRVPETPAGVVGHSAQLQRAVSNLLDNAILYSDRGTIALAVEQDQDTCRLTVADEGPGIPREAQAQIFDRFYRSDPSRSRPGSGLGLSMVKSIVQAHAGRVEVHSEPGRGSRFVLTLPSRPQKNLPPGQPPA